MFYDDAETLALVAHLGRPKLPPFAASHRMAHYWPSSFPTCAEVEEITARCWDRHDAVPLQAIPPEHAPIHPGESTIRRPYGYREHAEHQRDYGDALVTYTAIPPKPAPRLVVVQVEGPKRRYDHAVKLQGDISACLEAMRADADTDVADLRAAERLLEQATAMRDEAFRDL